MSNGPAFAAPIVRVAGAVRRSPPTGPSVRPNNFGKCDDTVLLGTPMNVGPRAIRITKANGEFAARELWTSRNLKPDFSDTRTWGMFWVILIQILILAAPPSSH